MIIIGTLYILLFTGGTLAGRLLTKPKIIGGEVVAPNSYPYQVGIIAGKNDGQHFCSGTLISPNFVLSTANCADRSIFMALIIGAHNISNADESTQIRILATERIIHPEWNPDTYWNNIALIKIPISLTFTDAIQPVTLPSYSEVGTTYEGVIATLLGWGKIADNDEDITDLLRSVESPLIEYQECTSTYQDGLIQESNFCTDATQQINICTGDNGGPAIAGGKQIGIASFGAGISCAFGLPSAFVRITSYLNWIEQNSDVTITP